MSNISFSYAQATVNANTLTGNSVVSLTLPNTSVNVVTNNNNTTSYNLNTMPVINVATLNSISIQANSVSNTYTYNLMSITGIPLNVILGYLNVNIASGGGGGGNSNPDYSWTATVSGAAKSAQSGYIAPVIFSNGSNNSMTNYQGGYIFPTTTTGNVDMYFERILGETGSISINVSTFSSTNSTANTNYTPLANTVLTWTDGEIGWKRVSIPIISIPTGFGLIGISMTGSAAWRPTAWVWMQGTGHVPGATYFQTSNGVNVGGSTSGSGTSGSPYASLAHAVSVVGSAGGVIYCQQNGTGSHVEFVANSAGAGAGNFPSALGININNINASLTSPIVILPDPNNTSVVTIDHGSSAGGSNIKYSIAFGINFQSNSSNIWICGLKFNRCNINWNPGLNSGAAGQGSNNVVWQCEIGNFSQNGSNAAGIRGDSNLWPIFQDCYIHEIYSDESSSTSNDYTPVASGFEEGIQMFNTLAPSITHCYVSKVQFGFMNKQSGASGTVTGPGWDIKHCFGDFFERATGGDSGALIHMPVQGSNWANSVVRYCVCDSSNSLATVTQLVANEQNATTANNFDIFNCIQINTNGIKGPMFGVSGVRIFNCISQASKLQEILVGAGPNEQLLYSDFNKYVGSSHSFMTGYSSAETNYTSLSAWQAAPAGTFLAVSPDPNSTSTTTIPSYTNQASHDYRIAGSGGRGNRPIGVGVEFVGIVNNFLNSGLPL